MVFPILLPTMNPSITFQIWDKDVIGSDDYISAVTMDFASQARDSFENDVSVKILGKQSFNLLGKVSKLFSSSSGKKEEDNGKKENDKKQDFYFERAHFLNFVDIFLIRFYLFFFKRQILFPNSLLDF